MELLNKEQLKERIKTTDKLCETHQIHLVQFEKPDRTLTAPYCQECEQEDIRRKEQLGVEQSLGHDLDYFTYAVFQRESMIPKEFSEATFSTFKASTSAEHQAKEFAIGQVKKYLDGTTGNTIFTGAPGTGKSHLSISMAKAINEGYKAKGEPKSVLFVSIADIVTKIQSGWQYKQSDFTEYDAVQLLTEVDYLFIDDLGTESIMSSQKKEAGDWVQGLLFKIFNARDTTIINTNHTGEELRKIYNDKLFDRIRKQSEGNTFKMTGIESKRYKQKVAQK